MYSIIFQEYLKFCISYMLFKLVIPAILLKAYDFLHVELWMSLTLHCYMMCFSDGNVGWQGPGGGGGGPQQSLSVVTTVWGVTPTTQTTPYNHSTPGNNSAYTNTTMSNTNYTQPPQVGRNKVVLIFKVNKKSFSLFIRQVKLTYRQPVQNGVLTDQLCRAIYSIHLSIMPMQIAITIT